MNSHTIILTSQGHAPGKTLLCISILTYIIRSYKRRKVKLANQSPVIIVDANEDNTSIYAWLRELRLPYKTKDEEYSISLSRGRNSIFEYYTIGDKVAIMRPLAQSEFTTEQTLELVNSLQGSDVQPLDSIDPRKVKTFLVDTGGSFHGFTNGQKYPPGLQSVVCPWIVWTHEAFNVLREYAMDQTRMAATSLKDNLSEVNFSEENIVHVFNPLLVAAPRQYQVFSDRTWLERIADFAQRQFAQVQLTLDGFFGGIEISNFSIYGNTYSTNGLNLDLQGFFDKINPGTFDRYDAEWAVADPKQNYEMVGKILCDNFTPINKRFNNIIAIPWYRYHLAVLRDEKRMLQLFISEIMKTPDAESRIWRIGDVLGLYYTPLEEKYYPYIFNWL